MNRITSDYQVFLGWIEDLEHLGFDYNIERRQTTRGNFYREAGLPTTHIAENNDNILVVYKVILIQDEDG